MQGCEGAEPDQGLLTGGNTPVAGKVRGWVARVCRVVGGGLSILECSACCGWCASRVQTACNL